jgi:hypothetical protein
MFSQNYRIKTRKMNSSTKARRRSSCQTAMSGSVMAMQSVSFHIPLKQFLRGLILLLTFISVTSESHYYFDSSTVTSVSHAKRLSSSRPFKFESKENERGQEQNSIFNQQSNNSVFSGGETFNPQAAAIQSQQHAIQNQNQPKTFTFTESSQHPPHSRNLNENGMDTLNPSQSSTIENDPRQVISKPKAPPQKLVTTSTPSKQLQVQILNQGELNNQVQNPPQHQLQSQKKYLAWVRRPLPGKHSHLKSSKKSNNLDLKYQDSGYQGDSSPSEIANKSGEIANKSSNRSNSRKHGQTSKEGSSKDGSTSVDGYWSEVDGGLNSDDFAPEDPNEKYTEVGKEIGKYLKQYKKRLDFSKPFAVRTKSNKHVLVDGEWMKIKRNPKYFDSKTVTKNTDSKTTNLAHPVISPAVSLTATFERLNLGEKNGRDNDDSDDVTSTDGQNGNQPARLRQNQMHNHNHNGMNQNHLQYLLPKGNQNQIGNQNHIQENQNLPVLPLGQEFSEEVKNDTPNASDHIHAPSMLNFKAILIARLVTWVR